MGQYFSNDYLQSNIRAFSCFVSNKKFEFFTDNGVFSKKGLDFGSRLLLETIPLEEVGGKVLDMGCGYGIIGVVINKMTGASVDMVDVNRRALHLSDKNIELNGCNNVRTIESFTYEKVFSKYSSIITNPPIRAGKKVVYDIVMNAKNHLYDDGKLFLVIRKEQGAKSLLNDLKNVYSKVNILEKKKGFYVIECSF